MMKQIKRIHGLSKENSLDTADLLLKNGVDSRPVSILSKYKIETSDLVHGLLNVTPCISEYINHDVAVLKKSEFELFQAGNQTPLLFSEGELSHGFVSTPLGSWVSAFGIEDNMLEEIDSKTLRKLEKLLSTILLYINHDSTVHVSGFGTDPEVTEFLNKSLQRGNFARAEVLSGKMHKYMYEDLLKGNKNIGIIFKNTIYDFCKLLEGLKEDKQRNYFNKIMKYGLFSLISNDDIFVQELSEKYPQLDFSETRWSREIHNDIHNVYGEEIEIHEFIRLYNEFHGSIENIDGKFMYSDKKLKQLKNLVINPSGNKFLVAKKALANIIKKYKRSRFIEVSITID